MTSIFTLIHIHLVACTCMSSVHVLCIIRLHAPLRHDIAIVDSRWLSIIILAHTMQL